MLDYWFHIGASINREENRNVRLLKDPQQYENQREISYITELGEEHPTLNVNLELIVRYITNLKLNARFEGDSILKNA